MIPSPARHRIAAAAVLALLAAATAGAWWHFHVPSRYFPASEVDHRAAPLKRIDLDIPVGSEGVEYFGKLRMDVFIDHRGRVDRVEVLESTLPQSFRDSAVKTFSEVRFDPAVKDGRAVKSVKRVEVDFAPPVPEAGAPMSGDR